MTRADIAAWVEQRTAAMNRHDVAALTRCFAPDCVVESPTAGGTIRGLQAVDEIHRAWMNGFPDVTFTTDGLLIDGDRIVWVATASGTDSGGFMGLPPTSRAFSLPMVLFTTLRDGLIVSERRIYDFTGMLMQIGVLKARPTQDTPRAIVANPAASATDTPAETAQPTHDEIAALLSARQSAWAHHDSRALADQHSSAAVMDSHLAGRVQGRSQIAELYAAWFAAFPDSQIRGEEVTVDGTHVAELSTLSGTDTGGFLGFPPTRRPFRLRTAWLYTVHDGRFAHVRPIYDFTGMLVQIGALTARPT